MPQNLKHKQKEATKPKVLIKNGAQQAHSEEADEGVCTAGHEIGGANPSGNDSTRASRALGQRLRCPIRRTWHRAARVCAPTNTTICATRSACSSRVARA